MCTKVQVRGNQEKSLQSGTERFLIQSGNDSEPKDAWVSTFVLRLHRLLWGKCLSFLFVFCLLQPASVTAMPTCATSTQGSASVPPKASRETSVSCEYTNVKLQFDQTNTILALDHELNKLNDQHLLAHHLLIPVLLAPQKTERSVQMCVCKWHVEIWTLKSC